MSTTVNKTSKPAARIFYLVIVFEIIYMVSPFRIYYYSTYGPSLNFLPRPQKATALAVDECG